MILLNSKVNKFKMIEAKQEQIIQEMDNAIGVYLMEMKDENDRLIKELSERKVEIKYVTKSEEIKLAPKQASTEMIDNQTKASTGQVSRFEGNAKNEPFVDEQMIVLEQPVNESIAPAKEMVKIVPKTVATNAYKKQNSISPKKDLTKGIEEAKPVDQVLTTFEQQVVQYHKEGFSIEEIAKKTQKGKTEIELLIKFHA